MIALWFMLAAATAAFAQNDTPFSIEVIAPETRLTTGQEAPLRTIVRDRLGRTVSALVVFDSTDVGVIEVDREGRVRARSVGVARITARVPESPAFAGLMFQSLPARVELTPSQVHLQVGDQQRFEIRALDVRNQPIPGIPWNWVALHDSGQPTNAASVDSRGMFRANGFGRFRVRAWLDFNTIGANLQRRLEVSAEVIVRARSTYSVDTLWRSNREETNPVFRYPLLPQWDVLRMNGRGEILLHAALGDMSNALLIYRDNAWRPVAAGGEASPERSGIGVITSFEEAAINENGDVLTRVIGGGETYLSLITAEGGSRPVHLNGGGLSATGVESFVQQARVSRMSLNRNRELVFLADTRKLNAALWEQAIYRTTPRGQSFFVASWDTALEGISLPRFDPRWMGITDSSVVFFWARDAVTGREAVFREAFDKPEKVIATGDEIAGSRMRRLFPTGPSSFFVGANGDLILPVQLENDATVFLRYLNGNTSAPPQVLQVGCQCGTLSSNEAGTLIWNMRGTRGLHVWNRDGSTRFVMSTNPTLPGGDIAEAIEGAAMDASGRIVVMARSAGNPAILYEWGDTPRPLLRAGDPVPVTVPTTLRTLLNGARSGTPLLQTGGGNLIWANDALETAFRNGTRLAGPPSFNAVNSGVAVQAPSGDATFLHSNSTVLRVTPSGTEAVAITGLPADSNPPYYYRENGMGQAIYLASNRAGEVLLYLIRDGQHTALLTAGLTAQPRMRIEDEEATLGGSCDIDTQVRVVCYVTTGAGINHVALWAGGQWRFLFRPGQRIGNQTATYMDHVSLAGGRIRARAVAGGTSPVEWEDGQWRMLLEQDDTMPNGRPFGHPHRMDVNGNGDILTTHSAGPGWSASIYRNGAWHTVIDSWEYTPDGDVLLAPFAINLSDDGTALLLCSTVRGELRVLRARPVN